MDTLRLRYDQLNLPQKLLSKLGLENPIQRTIFFSLATYFTLSVLKPNIAYENGRPRSFGPGFWPFDKQGSVITPTILSVAIGGVLATLV